ncbi:hypothetical protein LJR175_008586 [Variovorax sp. LjRoot175]
MHGDAFEMDDLRAQALRGAEQAKLGVDEGLSASSARMASVAGLQS